MGDGGTGHGGTGPGRSPAAGAVPAPDRRVLSVPGRGACGPRPHPPAAGGGPGQRCSLSTGCTGSLRRPRPSPQPGAACRGPRRPCAQVSDTGTSGGLSTYETAGGAGPGSHRRPLPCCPSLSRRMPLLASPGAPAALPACSPSSLGTWIRSPTALQLCVCSHWQRGGEAGTYVTGLGIACFEGRSHLLRWRCCVRAHDNQAADFEAL